METQITIEQIKECSTIGEVRELIGRWTEHQLIISRKEKPNTYEYGRAGNRQTLVYDTPEDLDKQIKSLKAMGYFDEGEK
jgi:hypothetical protein